MGNDFIDCGLVSMKNLRIDFATYFKIIHNCFVPFLDYLQSAAGVFRSRKFQLWQIVMSKNGIEGGYRSVR